MKIVLASKPTKWANHVFDELSNFYEIKYITPTDNIIDSLEQFKPDWIFFFHWSSIIKSDIHLKYKCVTIHTGNLPSDRGGSPIQNQILKGTVFTQVNAIVMADPVDSGDVYCCQPISLQGNLDDIWYSITNATIKLIRECVDNNPTPKPQVGTAQTHPRKTNNELNLGEITLEQVYDQIRMMDGNNYPNSFIEMNGFKFEFNRAKLSNDSIISDVRITKI